MVVLCKMAEEGLKFISLKVFYKYRSAKAYLCMSSH